MMDKRQTPSECAPLSGVETQTKPPLPALITSPEATKHAKSATPDRNPKNRKRNKNAIGMPCKSPLSSVPVIMLRPRIDLWYTWNCGKRAMN